MRVVKIIIDNLPITDWIQAFGAVLAIIAAIVGFIKLFRRDVDKQKQIDSLSELAEQASISNSLLTQQVSLIQKLVLLSESDSEKSQKRLEIESKIKKNQNLPRFEFIHCSANSEVFKLEFVNKGSIAKIDKVETDPEDNNRHISLITAENTTIEKDGRVSINVIPPSNITSVNQVKVKFRILFSDVEDNLYCQEIQGAGLKPKTSFPIELSK